MLSKTKTFLIKNLGLLLLLAFGPLFLAFSNPEKLPLAMLVVPFLWLFAVVFILVLRLVRSRVGSKRRRAIIAGTAAALPVLLLVLQSIHQLSVKDVLLVFVLLAAVGFYLSKVDFI